MACPGVHSTIRTVVPWPLPTLLYFLTKPARCEASASIELSTGMEFVDQISQPEMFVPRPRETALSFSSETTIPMPNSLWPVTTLLTSNVTVAPPVRFDHVLGFREPVTEIRPSMVSSIPSAGGDLMTPSVGKWATRRSSPAARPQVPVAGPISCSEEGARSVSRYVAVLAQFQRHAMRLVWNVVQSLDVASSTL